MCAHVAIVTPCEGSAAEQLGDELTHRKDKSNMTNEKKLPTKPPRNETGHGNHEGSHHHDRERKQIGPEDAQATQDAIEDSNLENRRIHAKPV